MKFQYLVAVMPMVVFGRIERELVLEQTSNLLIQNIEGIRAGLSSRQTCDFVEEYEAISECKAPFAQALEEILEN
eukprot:snap_masked-scaffold_59-processed-gene-0.66-mRNA-1 protein AED:1.00 eAED:1.00 QI:0/-1/0/0/-1/1/1/0/74